MDIAASVRKRCSIALTHQLYHTMGLLSIPHYLTYRLFAKRAASNLPVQLGRWNPRGLAHVGLQPARLKQRKAHRSGLEIESGIGGARVFCKLKTLAGVGGLDPEAVPASQN